VRKLHSGGPARLGRIDEIVIDNSAGGDADFAAEVCRRLRDRGFAVALREAGRQAMFDTAVHLVTAGLAVRLPEVPERSVLAAVEEDVRAALLHRPSVRRRTRSVPVHLGDTARVLEWIDVFD
jgi:hypothetical protein